MSKAIIEDLIGFLNGERTDLRTTACSTVLKLTGTNDGVQVILRNEKLLYTLFNHIDDSNHDIAQNCLNVIINLSSEEYGASALFSLTDIDVINVLVKYIKDPQYAHADLACTVLANMTRWNDLCPQILTSLRNSSVGLDGLVFILCQVEYNKKGASLDMLAPVIANFTQSSEGRREVMCAEKCIFVRLLPFTDFADSRIRRKYIISAIHNCCFEKDYHEWLLSEDVDLASRLALPLAGPDTFTLEENESLPFDLQFLPNDKRREEDAQSRALILETLMQLCTTKKGREKLRELNIYLILREYHKWERDEKCLTLTENVVNILIKTEEEIGQDDLSTVDVPSHLVKKFTNFDAQIVTENKTQ